ncbi:MAG: PHA-synthase 2, partial [Hyphomonadaceae bacterium]
VKKVTNDLFIVAGVTDHITPWKACYRTSQLMGSKNIEFVLSHSGHIQAMLNPPGNPKSKYYVNTKGLPKTPEKWEASAEQIDGSWWPRWAEWLVAHSGEKAAAPKDTGSAAHPNQYAAPGRYCFND